MTGRDLATGALRLIGVVASGEALDSAQATDTIASLNDMVDSWSNDDLLIPSVTREVFPITAGQAAYTIGTGGNFNTARPMSIENAWLQVTATTPTLEIPITVVTEEEWARIPLKGMSSTYPTTLYAEDTYPLKTVNLFPVPSQVNNLVLYTTKPLSGITLDTVISLPPGYARALRYNLAIEIAPEYGKQPSEIVASIAIQSLSEIKRKNFKPIYMSCDAAALTRTGSTSAEWYAMVGNAPDSDIDTVDGGTF